MSDERRKKRREMRLMQQESVWLQKALFALRKADAAHEKVLDARDEEEQQPYGIQVGDQFLVLEELEDALEDRVEQMLRSIREMRRGLMR